jgi:hypothetical protein
MLKPSRLIIPVIAAAVLAVPAPAGAQTARTAAYSPREEKAVQRAAGVGAPKAFAPRTRVLNIRDGQSVEQTVAELRARPEVATAAPNVRAHLAGFIPKDPGNARVAGGWQELQWNFVGGASVNAPDAGST